MKLYFLRHGIAADAQSWKGDDASRPLTDEGCDKMAREAKTIAKLDLDLDAILTSPLMRAKQTAKIVADRLDLNERLFEDRRLAGNFDTTQLAAILRDRSDAENLMLVGHEPDMSAIVGNLAGDADIDLKKGGLACVELSDLGSMQGRLLWLATPKLLTI
jgi:phosphohistidine phosphatase